MHDKDAAFAAFNKALEQGINQPGVLRYDPLLDELRADPRFKETIRRFYPNAAILQASAK
jgi:hypothetical protein